MEGGTGSSEGEHGEPKREIGMDEALGKGWAVGVCGWQYREAHEVSDGKGGLQENTAPCDFITEFVAPGGGQGRRGAGTWLLQEL